VSVKKGRSHGWELEENKQALYHFINFAIVNELLIIKYRRISPAYWLMKAHDEMRSLCQRSCLARGELFITSGNVFTRAARNAGPPFWPMIVSRLLFITK